MESETKEVSQDKINKIISTAQPPYTPSQLTLLVSDILNHEYEGQSINNNADPEEWDEKVARIKDLDEESVIKQWLKGGVAEWIFSRHDVPHYDTDHIAAEINKQNTEDKTVSHPILIHQLFKRFTEDENADYGFLRYTTFRHKSDTNAEEYDITNQDSQPSFNYEQKVRDNNELIEDQPEDELSTLIVTNPDAGQADKITLPNDNTVAEEPNNDLYPNDDRVVEIVYEEDLDKFIADWPEKVNDLIETLIKYEDYDIHVQRYYFPESRLKEVK